MAKTFEQLEKEAGHKKTFDDLEGTFFRTSPTAVLERPIADPNDISLSITHPPIENPKISRSRFLELRDAAARGLASTMSAAESGRAGLLSRVGPAPLESEIGYEFLKKTQDQQRKSAEKARNNAEFLWELSQNPDIAAQNTDLASKGLNMIGETLPYITATTAAYIATGPFGGFAVGSLVEGNSAYRNALAQGVDENKAKMIGTGVGIVSGSIEAYGGKYAEELFKKATAKITNKILKGGAAFGIGTIIEGLEEGTQEIAQITGESTYRDVDWSEAVKRTFGSAAGGVFLGGVWKGGGVMARTAITAEQKSKFENALKKNKISPVVAKRAAEMLEEGWEPADIDRKLITPSKFIGDLAVDQIAATERPMSQFDKEAAAMDEEYRQMFGPVHETPLTGGKAATEQAIQPISEAEGAELPQKAPQAKPGAKTPQVRKTFDQLESERFAGPIGRRMREEDLQRQQQKQPVVLEPDLTKPKTSIEKGMVQQMNEMAMPSKTIDELYEKGKRAKEAEIAARKKGTEALKQQPAGKPEATGFLETEPHKVEKDLFGGERPILRGGALGIQQEFLEKEKYKLAEPDIEGQITIGEKPSLEGITGIKRVSESAKREILETGIDNKERKSLIDEIASGIISNDIYQGELESLEQQAYEVGPGYYYIDKGYRGEVEAIIGKRRGFPNKIQRMFTFDPSETRIVTLKNGQKVEIGPTPWDRAVQEGLGRGKEGVEQTWGEMDISDFVQRVVDSYNAGETVGGVNLKALENARQSGEPGTELSAIKFQMLTEGARDIEINNAISEWAERWGIDNSEIIDEYVGADGDAIREIAAKEGAEQNEALERQAERNVETEQRAEAVDAAREILEANDIVPDIREVEELPERPDDDIPFDRAAGRKIGAALTHGQRETILLAYGADSETGYHEAYHILKRRLTDKDAGILDREFKGDEEAEARAFADFVKSGKARRPVLKAIWQKLKKILAKIRSGLAGKGFRTAEDVFAGIRRGKIQKGSARNGISYESEFRVPYGYESDFGKLKKQANIGDMSEDDIKNLTPELLALHRHPARKKGFNLATESEVKDYIRRFRNIAKSRNMTDIIELLDYAEQNIFEGYYADATDAFEGLLGYLHYDERSELSFIMNNIKDLEDLPQKLTKRLRSRKPREVKADKRKRKMIDVLKKFIKPNIKYETSGERLRREAEKNARIKAQKARLAARAGMKKKPKVSRRRINLKLQDYTLPLWEDLPKPEGPPGKPVMFSEPKLRRTMPVSDKPVPEDIYEANRQRSRMRELAVDIKREFQKAGTGFDTGTLSISSRLFNINPELKRRVRDREQIKLERIYNDTQDVMPLIKKFKKMPKKEWADLDLAIKNGDHETINKYFEKYEMGEANSLYREVDESIYNALIETGRDVDHRIGHFHRRVKPHLVNELYSYLRKRFGNTNILPTIEAAIQKRKEQTGGRNLTDEEKAQVINSVLRGYGGRHIFLSKPGGAKERSLFFIDDEINKFYYDTKKSMLIYINDMHEAISASEFFGRETKQIQNLRALKSRLATSLYKLQQRRGRRQPMTEQKYKEHISKRYAKLIEVTQTLEDLKKRDLTQTIGGYLMDLINNHQIDPDKERTLQSALESYFQPKSTGRKTGFFKTIAYMTHIGSPIQTLTQLKDYGRALYRAPVQVPGATMRSLFGKSKYSMDELGITDIAVDLSGVSEILDDTLRATFFKTLDKKMKEMYVDAVITHFQSQSRRGKNLRKDSVFMERLSEVFGNEKEINQVIKDLQRGDKTDLTKKLAFNMVLDMHPVARSEMTELYLRGGGITKYMYTLRTFGLKEFEYVRNEIFRDMKKHPVRSTERLVWMAFTLALAGAGVEELKDFMRGRKTKLSDTVMDQWLNTIMMSRYGIDILRREGPGKGMFRLITPPTRFIDAPVRDVIKGEFSETQRNIPIGGELYYWWFGGGAEKGKEEKVWGQ